MALLSCRASTNGSNATNKDQLASALVVQAQ
ncbi:hypothetical protein FOCG_11316 [Fusarium oxysporum f. sp. radicis-lycopersici 26381]|uniref:Uncharacterized protein n=1 Tax=Fusarium oxysporum Fo47 TaxID=660027 RepID=W9KQX4_FUSOX|nr:hypothetical protein FOZG_02888 [Fusarium oxysporum Fo47]EWZ84860.1 hypothetical protein FOWG_12551 [Fusarium oxysporum f. sp. lycopersici MN25]EXL47045.1 hypothetical protein FOCG_11316 [Fusarium oxysporum f. sp. radicis-lycopersici 26381]